MHHLTLVLLFLLLLVSSFSHTSTASAAAAATPQKHDDLNHNNNNNTDMMKKIMEPCFEAYQTITKILFPYNKDMSLDQIQQYFRDIPKHNNKDSNYFASSSNRHNNDRLSSSSSSTKWEEYEKAFKSCVFDNDNNNGDGSDSVAEYLSKAKEIVAATLLSQRFWFLQFLN